MSKKERQEAIKNLLKDNQDIDSQESLKSELSKAGFETTQSTISKDMKDIGVSFDRSTGEVKWDRKAQKTYAEKDLKFWFQRTTGQVINQDYSPILINVNPKFSNVLAHEIINYCKSLEIDVYSFLGVGGTIQILVPKNKVISLREGLIEIEKDE